jgi:hypothetical protein
MTSWSQLTSDRQFSHFCALASQESRSGGLEHLAAGVAAAGLDHAAHVPPDQRADVGPAEAVHALHGPHDARGQRRQAGHLRVPAPV